MATASSLSVILDPNGQKGTPEKHEKSKELIQLYERRVSMINGLF